MTKQESVTSPESGIQPVEVVAAVIRKSGKVLLASRKNMGWEFPGGKIEPGEKPDAALRRELAEELGIRNAVVLDQMYEIFFTCPDKKVHLHFFRTVIPEGEVPVPQEGQDIRRVNLRELPECGLLPADRPLAEFLSNGAE